mmetsp:Transcript_27163/g.84490  ORF Transcript_27163/g.84490 Transcript_27163/m.84490 type:complete len:314 (-) Transcript_27163:88-1029(-)
MALCDVRLLSSLGAPPGLEPPPGLTHPTKLSLTSCLAGFFDNEQERALAIVLVSRALGEKADKSDDAALIAPWLMARRTPLGAKVAPARSDGVSTTASEDDQLAPGGAGLPRGSAAEAPPAFRLRSTARPWLPQPPVAGHARAGQWPTWPHRGGSGDFAYTAHMSYLAEAAAWTVERAAEAAHVHRLRERRGWSVIARVSAADLARCAELLTAARREVLRQTQVLPGTFVMRSREKQQGFCISFGFVDDASKACWDAVQTGQCCRGQACRWEHPRNTRRLFVAVKLASKPPDQEDDAEESDGDATFGGTTVGL